MTTLVAQPLTVCLSHSPMMDATRPQDGPGGDFLSGVDAVKNLLEEFDPELVLFFGPDHRRALTNLVPTFTLATEAIGYGDWGTPTAQYDVDGQVTDDLGRHLTERSFDIAIASQIRLDHGFGQSMMQLFNNLRAKPIVPIVINCVGTPLSPLSRVIEFGYAVGEYLRGLDRRLAIVASGGLSHSPPSLETPYAFTTEEERLRLIHNGIAAAALKINPDWDRAFLSALARGDRSWLVNLSQAEINSGGLGANEIRTWVAAFAAGGRPLSTIAYEPVPRWITGMGIAASTGPLVVDRR